jgi:hypothetical protein
MMNAPGRPRRSRSPWRHKIGSIRHREEGASMISDFARKWAISRRNFLQSAAGAATLAALGLPPSLARAAEGPWSEAPSSVVDQINFVFCTFG